jgi:hypothetical protein
MSAYTSLTLTKGKAREICYDYLTQASDEQLRQLASRILEERSLYNVYQLVENNEPNDNEKVTY